MTWTYLMAFVWFFILLVVFGGLLVFCHWKASGSSTSRGLPASPQYPRTLRPSSSGTHLHALHPLPQQRKYLALLSQCRRGKNVR